MPERFQGGRTAWMPGTAPARNVVNHRQGSCRARRSLRGIRRVMCSVRGRGPGPTPHRAGRRGAWKSRVGRPVTQAEPGPAPSFRHRGAGAASIAWRGRGRDRSRARRESCRPWVTAVADFSEQRRSYGTPSEPGRPIESHRWCGADRRRMRRAAPAQSVFRRASRSMSMESVTAVSRPPSRLRGRGRPRLRRGTPGNAGMSAISPAQVGRAKARSPRVAAAGVTRESAFRAGSRFMPPWTTPMTGRCDDVAVSCQGMRQPFGFIGCGARARARPEPSGARHRLR